MRAEICKEGFVADRFVGEDLDRPVFGVNLACLYPFPAEGREVYEKLFAQLSALDPGVYVYPHWATHVTIATFVNFTQQIAPPAQRVAELTDVVHEIAEWFENAFVNSKPFDLWIEQPIISRKAAILPLSDLTHGIARIRTQLAERLAANSSLRTRLETLGLNIPKIVHSTIMRFKEVPNDTQVFLSKFDDIARTVPRAAMRVKEVYITTETKPYMRAGEIFHRFSFE